MSGTPAKSTPAKEEEKKDGDNSLSALLAKKNAAEAKKDDKQEENKKEETNKPPHGQVSPTNAHAENAEKNRNDEDERDAADSIGPDGDPNKTAYVYPKDIGKPVDNTDKNVRWATPDEISHMTAEQMAERYGIDNKISDEDADNPRVQVYRDTLVDQVPSGTHLHPDIAKDLLNRGIAERGTDTAQVKRTITEVYDFAPDAPHNDKF